MGDEGLTLEDAVTTEDLVRFISGKAIGAMAIKNGPFSFIMDEALYLDKGIDNKGRLVSGVIAFTFNQKGEEIDVMASVDGKPLEEETFDMNPLFEKALQNIDLTIYYQPSLKYGGPHVSFTGMEGRNPKVIMTVGDAEFLTKSDLFGRRQEHQPMAPAVSSRPADTCIDGNMPELVPLAEVIRWYFTGNDITFHAHQQKLRNKLKDTRLYQKNGKSLYELLVREEGRRDFYVKKEYLPIVDQVLARSGFESQKEKINQLCGPGNHLDTILPEKTLVTDNTPEGPPVGQPVDDTADRFPLADLILGYAPQKTRKDETLYNRHQANIREPLKKAGVYKLFFRVKGKRGLFLKKELLPKIHELVQADGYEWHGGKNMDERLSPYSQPQRTDDKPKTTPPVKSEPKKGKTKPTAPAEPLSIDDAVLQQEVKKAVDNGDIKLEDALYRLISRKYDHFSDAREFREMALNYAVTELVGDDLVYLVMGQVPVARTEKLKTLYTKIMNYFSEELAELRKKVLVGREEFDFRFTPFQVEAIFNYTCQAVDKQRGNKNKVSTEKIKKRIREFGFDAGASFKHLYLLRDLAIKVCSETSDCFGRIIEEDKAMGLLEGYGIQDPITLMLNNEGSIKQNGGYSEKEVRKLGIVTDFKKKHPYVFYV